MYAFRKMEISVVEVENRLRNREVHTAFVSGYLMNKLPSALEKHLNTMHSQSLGPRNLLLRATLFLCFYKCKFEFH